MKKLLLLLTLLFSLNTGAQTLHFDLVNNMVYVNIQPMPIPWLSGDSIKRLYIKTRAVDVAYDASTASMYFGITVDYYVNYPVVVDGTTTNWFSAFQGTVPGYRVSPSLPLYGVGQAVVNYIADSATVNGHFLNLTIAP